MLLPVLLGLLLPLLPCVAAGCCWCDPATPDSARTFLSGVDNQSHALVFSDEFDSSSRNFSNGRDTKWTALSVGDTSNKGQAFYLPEQAAVVLDPRTNDSALRILTERRPRTGPGPDGEVGISMPAVSAMLQTWNKFCFTGGVLEFRARMPGGAGYWPALWTFGNLGRAIYQDSNTGLWPWSFDECDGELALHAGAPPQKISACNDHSLLREGLHGFQGRGATELDVVEAAVTNSGGGYAVGSLQLSPAIPNSFRPSWCDLCVAHTSATHAHKRPPDARPNIYQNDIRTHAPHAAGGRVATLSRVTARARGTATSGMGRRASSTTAGMAHPPTSTARPAARTLSPPASRMWTSWPAGTGATVWSGGQARAAISPGSTTTSSSGRSPPPPSESTAHAIRPTLAEGATAVCRHSSHYATFGSHTSWQGRRLPAHPASHDPQRANEPGHEHRHWHLERRAAGHRREALARRHVR
jgi:hypothetical protein